MKQKLKSVVKSSAVYIAGVFLLIGAIAVSYGFVRPTENFFEIGKNIELLGRIYKDVSMNYVDQISVSQFMRAGIDGMLSTLDPYTVFMDEEQSDDIDQLTTGKYAGIGVTTGTDKDGGVIIVSVTDGYSADKAGLRIGDRIVKVNGTAVKGRAVSDVRTMMKGEAGTEVKLSIEREGERSILEFSLIRQEIMIKNIPFADIIEGNIGYIKLERFNLNAAEEMSIQIRSIMDSALNRKTPLKGFILDLRGNPGGLLDAAVSITSKFVPQGSAIVTTRGRDSSKVRVYNSVSTPYLKDIPLVVMINGNSASASEIVAGAVQDLDRGVIVGTRSFGKGLVQTITRLPYNTSLKITTAKYYTPSGRLIQAVDYFHRNQREGKRNVFIEEPDTLHNSFKTKIGRTVYDGGGIAPDVHTDERETTPLETALWRNSLFFKFANSYQAKYPKLPEGFKADDKLFNEFKQYLAGSKFDYQSDAERKLQELIEAAEKNYYNDQLVKQLKSLQANLVSEKNNDLERQKNEILSVLETEIITRYQGERMGIAASLNSDVQLNEAISVLMDQQRYKSLLSSGHEVGKTPGKREKSKQARKKS
ncbi:MAG: S41 family peptidase [Chloroherpetonaceae bacterium]|nr:S41 family peptidase [Chloroherpetonaceae bacterium]